MNAIYRCTLKRHITTRIIEMHVAKRNRNRISSNVLLTRKKHKHTRSHIHTKNELTTLSDLGPSRAKLTNPFLRILLLLFFLLLPNANSCGQNENVIISSLPRSQKLLNILLLPFPCH